MNSAVLERPEHVPAELVRQFDVYAIPGSDKDVHMAWKAVADNNPPIFWTPCNGGHWVTTIADDIVDLQTNYEDFSMVAATVPRQAYLSLPLEADPPYHTSLRGILSPLFRAATMKKIEAHALEVAIRQIEHLAPLGKCEFVKDFAQHLPIAIFLMLVDLPFEDRHILLPFAEQRFRSPDPEVRAAARQGIIDYCADVVAARRKVPGDDVISLILHAQVQGRAITDDEANSMLATVMSGGLDTVASAMSFAARFLANNPGHRQQLIEHPELVPNAVNELMRRFGIANTARLVAHDVDLHGVALKKGDQIMGPSHLYGLDEEKFPNPLEVDFTRQNAATHAAFGNGVHKCPGMNIARLEIGIFLREWLARIPDFARDPEHEPVMKTGMANTLQSLNLKWETK